MGSIEPAQPDYDVLIIGAGLSGCYASYRMGQMSAKFRVLKQGQQLEVPGIGVNCSFLHDIIHDKPLTRLRSISRCSI